MKAATRLKVNVIIDVFLFLSMILVGAIGLILKYVLIHGSDRWEKYGDNVDLRYLGLDRHQWGYIHWIISLVLIGLVVLHLVFHWKQIVCLVKKYLPVNQTRRILVAVFLLVSLLLSVSPFLFSIEIGDPVRGNRNEAVRGGRNEEVRQNDKQGERLNRKEVIRSNSRDSAQHEHLRGREKDGHQHSEKRSSLDIQGFYTIAEVAEKYRVRSAALKEMLGIPNSVSNNERLGRLRRTYGFSMSEVERCVLKLQEKD